MTLAPDRTAAPAAKPALAPCAAPVISTARLTLRRFRRGDWPAFAAALTSERAIHMGGPFDTGTAWSFFCAATGAWSITGTGALAVEAGGVAVGEVALNDLPAFPEFELGWVAFDGQEGRGYMAEAAAAFRDWIAAERAVPSLVSYVSPGNARSVALARRLGAVRDAGAPLPEGETAADTHAYRHWGPA